MNALNHMIEGANSVVDDAPAFLAATQAIDRLLVEDWPEIEAGLDNNNLSDYEQKHLLNLLEAINRLETKTRARLAWSEDFEIHMRRAMEMTS